jgi:transposase
MMANPPAEPVKAAIKLAIQIAHSKDKIPKLATIARIFDTTYDHCVEIYSPMARTASEREVILDPKKLRYHRPKIPRLPNTIYGQDGMQLAVFTRNLLSNNPELTHNEIAKALQDEFGVEFRRGSISRILKKYGIPHRKNKDFQHQLEEATRALALNNPELSQRQMSEYLQARFGVRITRAAVSSRLRKLGVPYTRKSPSPASQKADAPREEANGETTTK